MKKLNLSFLVVFFLTVISCQQYVDYTLRNETDYDVIVEDQVAKRYTILAHEEKFISHANSANFQIIDNQYPIYIKNLFTLSVIKPLPTYEVYVYNDTSKQYELNVNNDPYQKKYIITPGSYVLKVYAEKPSIKLFFSKIECHNYFFMNNTLHIF